MLKRRPRALPVAHPERVLIATWVMNCRDIPSVGLKNAD
jgi:hypothetical protein